MLFVLSFLLEAETMKQRQAKTMRQSTQTPSLLIAAFRQNGEPHTFKFSKKCHSQTIPSSE